MKEIPCQLQCAYCVRNVSHGGECTCKKSYYDTSGCLIFKADERGCIRNTETKIRIPLYFNFPVLNTWCDYWTVHGVDTEVRVNRIKGLEWDTKAGELLVWCDIDYYVNEYHEDYEEPKQKPHFEVIKNDSLSKGNKFIDDFLKS